MTATSRSVFALAKHVMAGAVVALTCLAGATPAAAVDLIVQYDQVMLQPLDKPASQIIIGNPSIADVSLQNNTTLAITGKTFGMTNMIVLDADQKIILNQRVIVKSDAQRVVSLNRGGDFQTYSCTPKCEPVLKVGDEKEKFALIASSSQQKLKISESSDSGQGGN
jgi:Pilus formation protein N terminal region